MIGHVVADGYGLLWNVEHERIRLSLMLGSAELATIVLEEDEVETLIVQLRETMAKAKAAPRRLKHTQ